MKNFKLTKTALLFTSLVSGMVFAHAFEFSVDDVKDHVKLASKLTYMGENVGQSLTYGLKGQEKAFENEKQLQTLEKQLKDKIDKSALEAKADKSALEMKADKSALEAKADKSALEMKADKRALEAKADKSALELKADKRALEAKADKSALELKADKRALEAKADKSALEMKADKRALEAKADKSALELKADKRALEGKADKSALDAANLMIQRNQQAIALLAPANITKLHEQVQSNTARLNKLDKELQRGVATQAALSGLFQPYNVGKVNVTAAVGGYKSKSAVAVGMGYRVNEKFATKAGIAVSIGNSSSAAYNVGVNYEF